VCPAALAEQLKRTDDARTPASPPLTPYSYRDVRSVPDTAARPAITPYMARQRTRTIPAERPAGGAQSPAVQWLSALFCTSVIITCLVVAGTYISSLPRAGIDPATQLAGALIAIAIGAVAGVLPLYWTARAYAGIAYTLLAITLFTCGMVLIAAAPVVRQMNTPELAEYRGFNALLTFGILAAAAGLGLGAACIRWSLHREVRTRLLRWSIGLAVAYGVLLILAGLLGFWGAGEAIEDDASLGIDQHYTENAILVACIAAGTLLPGLQLLSQAVARLRRRRSRPLIMPVAALGVLAFGAVLAVGHANMTRATPIAAPMPVLHTLGAALPGITYAALASRGSLLRGQPVRGISTRHMLLAATLALSVGLTIAVYVELLGSWVALTMILVRSNEFASAESFAHIMDVYDLSNLLLSEKEQLLANLIAAAVLAPLVEEFAKSVGVRFLMRPSITRAHCFLLGASAGAAFGFMEAMLYGAGWVSEEPARWWEGMVVRGGSTSGHVLWTGVCGIAWWYWRSGAHRTPLALFGLAMFVHGAWNGVFTIIDSRIYILDELSFRTVEIIAYVIVGVWSLLEIAAIPLIARRLREPSPPPVAGTALASLQPWLA
jgi:hypothetical protein